MKQYIVTGVDAVYCQTIIVWANNKEEAVQKVKDDDVVVDDYYFSHRLIEDSDSWSVRVNK